MKTEFLKELRDLLFKYNASINWNCSSCSDTHGIYDEEMTIAIRKGNAFNYEQIFSTPGNELDYKSIDDQI